MSTRLLALGASAALLLAACGGGATTAPSTAPTGTATATATGTPAPSASTVSYSGYIACVAFDTGGLGDKGFNDLAMKGLNDAKALGFTTFFSEAKNSTDYANNIQSLIDKNCKSIVTVGFNQGSATDAAVKANP